MKVGIIGDMEHKPKVDVLLGTLNGEKYLAEFLESLLAQESVSINLIVSDDGSVDRTLDILGIYKDRFPSFQFVPGPKQGAAKNYLFLLRLVKNEFAAFADQDDIWDRGHLIKSIERMKNLNETPALSYSAMREVYENHKMPERIWPTKHSISNLNSILLQNYARGCSMVFNKKAVELITKITPKYLIMHDWWALQVIFTHGKILFGSNPELTYRIHESNSIGIPTRWNSYTNFIRELIVGKWGPFGQAKELNEIFGETMNEEARVILRHFLELQKFSLSRILSLFTQRISFKEKIEYDVSFRFALFLIPIATRKWKE